MRDSTRPPTLSDVARRAGLAKSTVSEALRDHGRVKRDTRERVQALALEMGYVPNNIAATLAASKVTVPVHELGVAYLLTATENHRRNGRFIAPPFPHLRRHLSKLGYRLEVFDTGSMTAPALRNHLFHRGFRGVIFNGVDVEVEGLLLKEDWSSFCVLGGTRNFGLKFDLIRNNHFQAVCVAWNQARARGYTRIGAVLGRHPTTRLDDLEREGAVAALQRNLGAKETAIPPYLGEFTSLRTGVPKWYHRHRPDVVLGFNYSFSGDLLVRHGVRIPQDVAFISLVDQQDASLACVNPETQAEQILAEQIDQMIRHQRVGQPEYPREILPSVRWHPGPSLPGDPVIELSEPFRYAG